MRMMRVFYQSFFYKTIVVVGCIIATYSLIKDLFFSNEHFPIKNITINTICLLISFIYLLDILFLWKKYRIEILMFFVFFAQIMLPIINRYY